MKPWQKWTLAAGAAGLVAVLMVLALGIGVEVGTVQTTMAGNRTTTHVVTVNTHVPLP
jgi:hypothetical protein